MTRYKERALEMVERAEEDIKALCCYIHEHPELGFQEVKSSKAIANLLETYGFQVEMGVGGIETAFRAEADTGKEGPVIGFLCEYDALPGIGHGCGHNIIGSASAGAAIAAFEAAQMAGGKIVVIGTPAEEGSGGGKELLLRAGVMDDLDCAMMSHPGPWTSVGGTSLAIQAMRFTFHGRASHASATPEQGISALEAVIQMFNQVNALRTFLPVDSRVNGIITKGGVAPNIIPDECEAVFNIRADSKKNLKRMIERISDCAKAAALGSGCTVQMEPVGIGYDEIIPNDTLLKLLEENLTLLGETIDKREQGRPLASTDIGNVTHHIPAFQAMFRAAEDRPIPHSLEFTRACGGEKGAQLAVRISRVLSCVACDILEHPAYIQQAKEELNQKTIGEQS